MKAVIYTFLIAIVAIGGWILIKNDNETPDENLLVLGSDGSISGAYSLDQIVSLDESYECQYKKSDSDSSIEGKIFIGPGGKVRGDFVINSESTEAPFESHLIIRAGQAYVWTSLLDKGFIILDVSKADLGEISAISLSEKLDYTCSRVQNDPSHFVVPNEIEFSTINK